MKVGCGPKSCETKGRFCPALTSLKKKPEVRVSQLRRPKVVLIIDRQAREERVGRPDEAILVGIVHLSFFVVGENQLVLPFVGWPPIKMRRD